MLKLTAFIYLILCFTSCKEVSTRSGEKQKLLGTDRVASILSDTTKSTKRNALNKYYPFELQEIGGKYLIVANIESESLYPEYYNFFQKQGYEGNGYCWEGHITQILEKLDKKLLGHIDFDPEAGAFFATADSKDNQIKFAKLLSPIFSDLKKLGEWVKKADRSHIDD